MTKATIIQLPRIHLYLNARDTLRPCPFCGRHWNPDADPDDDDDPDRGPELANTHTPSYWIECPCGAQVQGRYYDDGVRCGDSLSLNLNHKRDRERLKRIRRAHALAKRDAVKRWNTRCAP